MKGRKSTREAIRSGQGLAKDLLFQRIGPDIADNQQFQDLLGFLSDRICFQSIMRFERHRASYHVGDCNAEAFNVFERDVFSHNSVLRGLSLNFHSLIRIRRNITYRFAYTDVLVDEVPRLRATRQSAFQF